MSDRLRKIVNKLNDEELIWSGYKKPIPDILYLLQLVKEREMKSMRLQLLFRLLNVRRGS